MRKYRKILTYLFYAIFIYLLSIIYLDYRDTMYTGEYSKSESIQKSLENPLIKLDNDLNIKIRKIHRPPPETLPWYMEGGMVRPTVSNGVKHSQSRAIWPDGKEGDRITEQLMFRPPTKTNEYKKILSLSHHFMHNNTLFEKLNCPVSSCILTRNPSELFTADAVVRTIGNNHPETRPNLVNIIFNLESPKSFGLKDYKDYNWTATYRRDSDIVTPYGRWEYYVQNVRQTSVTVDYAAGKTKQVAWFVSNCHTSNNRLEYAVELSKHIEVDGFGSCNWKKDKKTCPRQKADECFNMLKKDYKFYLSFENSNCRDYITEKFFLNGLQNDVIPIVMGAHPDDYKRVAPEGSYIHVDDFESPKHLAEYLHLLDSNDELYNQYFRWKGTGEFIDTKTACRVCALLHDELHENKYYEELEPWWNPEGICISGSWFEDTPA